MKIGNKQFIIAEMSGNHGGDLSKAQELIAAAHKCGCDAIKIQTYEPEDLCDPANNEIYEKCKIPRDWHPILFETAKKVGIPLFSSVFSVSAIEFLERFYCPAYKIASPESTRLTNYKELAAAIRATGQMFIASSGRGDFLSIAELDPDWMLYCVAGYPAKVDILDLEFMATYSDGFSDHTDNLIAPLAMIGAGAKVIEKHFKLDDDCIDAAFSLNPEQMATLCRIAHR